MESKNINILQWNCQL